MKEILKWKELPETHSLRQLMMVPIMVRFYDICTKIQGLDENSTVHTYDFLVADGVCKYPDSYDLYVEWGTATTILSFEHISPKLKEYLREYRSPHGGVAMGIYNMALCGEKSFDKYNLLNDINKDLREELFKCLGLKFNASFDEFANKYGGVTKEEMLRNLSL